MRLLLVAGLLLFGTVAALLASLSSGAENSTLTGTLAERDGVYSIDGRTLDLGPDHYVTIATASVDFDEDGTIESLVDELDGLVGTTVTVENLDPNREDVLDINGVWNRIKRGDFSWPPVDGDFDVYTINGHPYRDPDSSPPWSGPDEVEAAATPAA